MTLAVNDLQERRLSAAWVLAREGFSVVETEDGHKEPIHNEWQHRATRHPDDIAAFLSRSNRQFGVYPARDSRVFIVDFDVQAEFEAMQHLLPDTLTIATSIKNPETGWRGRHVYLRLPKGISEDEVKRTFMGGEVRIAGSGQVVGPWGRHPSGSMYEPMGSTRTIAEASKELIDAIRESHERRRAARSKAKGPDDEDWLITEPGRHDFLLAKGRYLRGVGLTGQRLAEELRRLNSERCDPPKTDEEVDGILRWLEANITDDPPEPILYHSKAMAPAAAAAAEADGGAATPVTGKVLDAEDVRYARTDSGNAELFAALYGDNLRYDHRRGRWLVWDGFRWKPDVDGEVYRMAMDATRHRFAQSVNITDLEDRKKEAAWAIGSESKQRIEAALALAANLHPITDAGDRWDSNPMLLGVLNGVIDLTTGQLRPALQSDLITKQAGAIYDPEAKCPHFEQFIADIFNGNAALIEHTQVAFGYSLTGNINEQCFWMGHGEGGNGKSTLLEAIKGVWGDYAITAPFSTFTASKYGDSGPSNDVARLDGARLVTAIEPTEGASFNEARVKELTGGDQITARFLRREFFTFTPQFKLWLAVNSKPGVRDLSRGFWRRIRILPFERDFEAEGKADKHLADTLRDEAPGILAWAVRGCLQWQRQGLSTPAEVVEAVHDYQEENNPATDWMADRLVAEAGAWVSLDALYTDYTSWMDGEFRSRQTLGRRRFQQAVAIKFHPHKKKTGQGFDGCKLAPLPHLTTIAERQKVGA